LPLLHKGHVIPSGNGFVFLQLGYAEHPWNSPFFPRRRTIGAPHLSHFSPVSCATACFRSPFFVRPFPAFAKERERFFRCSIPSPPTFPVPEPICTACNEE